MKSLLVLVASAACAFAAVKEPVRVTGGLVTGTAGKDASVRVFKGIPFAAPPVGDLRWKAPQPPVKWDGEKKADAFSPNCTTGAAPGGRGGAKGGAPAGPAASEDCLYVNVWTAAKSESDKLPVFVWTYGGGFTTGSGSQPRYDGEALAKKGIVVVNYNYRLGVFGFLSHPDLAKESSHNSSGNYGMMDYLAVLKWVQANAAAFGGDPKKVTIAGESAGSIMVGAMVASPEGKGLFQRAIGQSGAWLGLSPALMKTRAQAETEGKNAAGTKSIAELRALSAQDAAQALRVQAAITIDGYILPEDASTIFAKGKQNHVDVLVGSNGDEGTFFGGTNIDAARAAAGAKDRYGDAAADFLKLYPSGSDAEAVSSNLARIRDEVGWTMRTWAQLQSKQGKKAYVYYFTHVPPGAGNRGASHTAELEYMFGNPPANAQWTDADRQLSATMVSYWANFTATGDPNGKGLPRWEAYNPKSNDGKAMVLGDTVAFGPQVDSPRLTFLDKQFATLQAKLK